MKLMVVLANGFEEIEAIAPIDILRRAEVDVEIVGLTSKTVKGKNNVKIIADKKLGEIKNFDKYQGIILPGGSPGYKHLLKSRKLIEIVRRFFVQGKLIAAICAAPLVLKKAGILEDVKVTAYPTLEKEFKNYIPSKVLRDRNVITARGPGAAIDFGLEIVRIVKGEKVAKEVRDKL